MGGNWIRDRRASDHRSGLFRRGAVVFDGLSQRNPGRGVRPRPGRAIGGLDRADGCRGRALALVRVPIPVVLLVATRVRTPAWLRERGGLRGWLPMGLVLAVPTAAILTAVPLYRAYEIPVVSPGFSPQEYFSPPTNEEKATMDIYREASRLVVHNDPEAIQRAAHASRRPACDCFDPFGRNTVVVEMSRLGRLVLFSGDSFRESGNWTSA